MDLERLFRAKTTRRTFCVVSAAAVGSVLFKPPSIAEATPLKELEKPPVPEVLMYHEVTFEQLKRDFTEKLDQGYRNLTPEEYVKYIKGEIEITDKTFIPTFDDVRLSQYDTINKVTDYFFQEKGIFIPVMLFALTKFNDLPLEDILDDTPAYEDGDPNHFYMSKTQIVDLIRRGHYVGNHTINHPQNLPVMNIFARNDEIENGDKRILHLWKSAGIERPYKIIAYPYGRHNDALLEYIKEQEYDAGFATDYTTQNEDLKHLAIIRVRKS